MPHSGRLRPYSQTLDKAVKTCQGQTQVITKICKLRTKKFYNIGPSQNGCQTVTLFKHEPNGSKKQTLGTCSHLVAIFGSHIYESKQKFYRIGP
jgi:hypothetical protein